MQLSRCAIAVAYLCTALARPTTEPENRLNVHISVADGILNGSTEGHIQLMFAPAGAVPLDDTDVTSSPNYFFGQNVYDFGPGSSVTLSGGSGDNTDFGVF